jgi:hypothetical protein
MPLSHVAVVDGGYGGVADITTTNAAGGRATTRVLSKKINLIEEKSDIRWEKRLAQDFSAPPE